MSIFLPSLAILAIFFPSTALAFPEMVRHGYVNCTSCHVSPSGGGVLNPYGRALSNEVLSAWGTENETAFIHGLVKSPEWLNLGGDFREAYVYVNTPSFQEGRFVFMQADLEAAATLGKWSAVGTIGFQDPGADSGLSAYLISRRHYFLFRPTDEISFRAGRFFYHYGLNMPEHTLVIRGGLAGARTGLQINDQGFETYNVEASWIGEKHSTFVTGILGRLDAPDLNREQGIALNSSIPLGESHKLGFSLLHGTTKDIRRHVFGPYAALGFSPRFFLLSELDFQRVAFRTQTLNPVWGFANYNRLNYEWSKGFHTYITQEFGRLDFSRDRSIVKAFGLGTQFFPRPHFEFNFTWQKQVVRARSRDYMDVAYLLLHYYL